MKRLAFAFFALTAVAPQDEYFKQQWYLQNYGFSIRRDLTEISSYAVPGKFGADIHYPFDLTLTPSPRKPVVVAVLDTGVDIAHAELKDSILRSSECDRLGNIPPRSAPDSDHNGFAGDCAGWNFASATSENGDNQVYDDVGHGTHISGLIAAKVDSIGIRGISDQIKILPVKIFNKYEIPNHPQRPKMKMMDRIAKGLEYAIQKNVDVINLSLGWPSILDSPRIRSLFDLAEQKNILIVAAAGNNSQHTTIFPCSYSSVLCVGATTVDGTLAPFSNYGGNVDVLAPGENILSTIPKKITPLFFDEDGYDIKNGTSQAAPLVAGSAALMKLALGELSVNELKARILGNASRVSTSSLSALYGSFNLSQAIQSKPDQFVYPNLKELNTVEVSASDGRFQFEVKLESWIPSNVEAAIQLKFGDALLDQGDYQVYFTPDATTHQIIIRGKLDRLDVSSTQLLSLALNYGEHHYRFQKEITFALNAESVSQRLEFSEKIDTASFRSVDDPFLKATLPLFYTQTMRESAWVLQFFREQNARLEKIHTLAYSSDLKLVATAFLNLNQVAIETYDQKNQKLIYDFWDFTVGRTPQKIKTLEMVPDSAVFTLKDASFINLSPLKAVLLTRGKISPSEQNKSVFVNPQTGSSDHFYYFYEEAGKILTGMLDSDFMRKEISRRYHLRFDDALIPLAVLTQGSSDSTQAVDALVVIGKGYSRKVLKIRFRDRNDFEVVQEYQVPGAAALREIPFLGRSMLAAQERKEAYQVFDLEKGTFVNFEWNDRMDDLLGPITMISPSLLLAQTQTHFVVLGKGSGGEQKIPVKRFSFLPGELFSDMFTPVEVKLEGKNVPGLFIDGTMISEKHIGVVLWNGERLVKPVYFQEKLPSGCRVMNPQRMNGVFQILLLCESSNHTPYLLKRELVN